MGRRTLGGALLLSIALAGCGEKGEGYEERREEMAWVWEVAGAPEGDCDAFDALYRAQERVLPRLSGAAIDETTRGELAALIDEAGHCSRFSGEYFTITDDEEAALAFGAGAHGGFESGDRELHRWALLLIANQVRDEGLELAAQGRPLEAEAVAGDLLRVGGIIGVNTKEPIGVVRLMQHAFMDGALSVYTAAAAAEDEERQANKVDFLRPRVAELLAEAEALGGRPAMPEGHP